MSPDTQAAVQAFKRDLLATSAHVGASENKYAVTGQPIGAVTWSVTTTSFGRTRPFASG